MSECLSIHQRLDGQTLQETTVFDDVLLDGDTSAQHAYPDGIANH